MHTFQVGTRDITAHTEDWHVYVEWYNDKGGRRRLSLKSIDVPGRVLSAPFGIATVTVRDFFLGVGDEILYEMKEQTYYTAPGELEMFWNANGNFRDLFPHRIVNLMCEYYKEIGGSDFGDGYHPFSLFGTPQQPVVYSWTHSNSSYVFSPPGTIEDQATGSIQINEPTNGTAPFDYSCVLKGNAHSYSSTQEYSSLAVGTYEISVRDDLGVIQNRTQVIAQGNQV